MRTSDKQRFALSPDGLRIRANQGHSVDVELGSRPRSHRPSSSTGRPAEVWPVIQRDGLAHGAHARTSRRTRRPRRRWPSAAAVTSSSFAWMPPRCTASGHRFFRSENGVWLTEAVPPRYLAAPE